MPVRRSLALAAATALLAAPLLSSCGFNANTNLVNTNTTGTGERSGTVDIGAATVVASGPDEGTLIANLSNNNRTEEAVFDTVTGGEGAEAVTAADFTAITIPPGGYVNLADDAGVKLTGTFEAGDVIPLAIGFEGGETVTLDVPVVRACGEYAGLDEATPSEAPTTTEASPSAGATPSAEATPSEAPGSDAPSADSSTESGAASEAYSCTPTESESAE